MGNKKNNVLSMMAAVWVCMAVLILPASHAADFTQLVKGAVPVMDNGNSNPQYFVYVNGATIYFAATTAENGRE
ncbi:MAG TPA: hypothetical protein PLS31_05025, partial [Candidatus Sumerlaeota bacterium]|nr:hypothetical protein [Candidatus Sumerlaeota bacterium]